ncbi:MAG TPA: rRNA maturation RNase YbeY [Acidobacteriota bacterium]|nr:rRNA maturation RNase YbeY [Acidobacteriota bacterium]HRR25246.1 rRNA maturation RNase YbeY [Acidobacteriota bacterium]HRR55650.1 rRNA maturation RNase YbeY [Acidobacteriota bacterium]HRV08911.1 rRNA maturation RNase YbeY [Acidobacteriota bacterium]
MSRTKNPKVRLFNRQRSRRFDRDRLESFCRRLSEELDLQQTWGVILVGDRKIAELNRRFRHRSGPTDVLSFPTSEEDRRVDPYLGDIFISVETADRQKTSALEDELCLLILHGVLHLLGYDHETDEGEMHRREECLRDRLGLPIR